MKMTQMQKNQVFPIGTHLVHATEGDVGVVLGFRTRADLGLIMYRVTDCDGELPDDELRHWSVFVDGSLHETYKALQWDCRWDISRSDDNFMCIPDAPVLETLVSMGLAEKKAPCWYRAIECKPAEHDSLTVSYWAE